MKLICLLSLYNYFLRVFKLKNKFRQLAMKELKKNKTLSEKYLAVLPKSIMDFKQFLLNLQGEIEKNLNQLG